MRTKDSSVKTAFHWILTELLFEFNELYRSWGGELVITSGSEHSARHGKNSLHYAIPACGVDTRTWDITDFGETIDAQAQHSAMCLTADKFCDDHDIPREWIEVILERHHVHTEFQPKRVD